MLGGIGGDISGSKYEKSGFNGIKTSENEIKLFTPDSRITDDTFLTLAVAEALLTDESFDKVYKKYITNYVGYPRYEKNSMFFESPFSKNTIKWSNSNYVGTSIGNGAPMRISSIPLLYDNLAKIQYETIRATAPTHSSKEAFTGALALASSIYFAKKKYDKEYIKEFVEKYYNYSLDFNLKTLQEEYTFHSNCADSVPQAIFIFLISNSYEDCLKKAISIGGDTDTIANMSGSIAGEFFGIPEDIENKIISYLTPGEENIVKLVYKNKRRNKI